MQGYGVYRWANGAVYYGHWKENSQDGYGYQIYPDGRERFGQWKNGKKWEDELVEKYK